VIDGVRVGHWSDPVRRTGCTVVLLPPRTTCSAEVRGLAPGTRELALLEPHATVQHADAIVLCGGSAFGLAACDGVMAGLAEMGRGFPTPAGPVPIVPAAVIYDRAVGEPAAPGPVEGALALAAALAAGESAPPARGAVGAGTGATVGSLDGPGGGGRGGIGLASIAGVGGASLVAIAVVNAFGDVLAADGSVLAGLRDGPTTRRLREGGLRVPVGESTTLVVVGTDARLDKAGCHRLARAAHAGIARATSPAATAFDGDTAFAFATGSVAGPHAAVLESAVQELVADAIRDGVR
jgi:L-aminopeptidase/D-esterase-like protein